MRHKLRHYISLVESISPTYPSFIDHLFDAVEAAQVGFYFEEGGCFGMALALYDRFRLEGYAAELMVSYRSDNPMEPSHAFVHYAGHDFDYTGVPMIPNNEVRRVLNLRQFFLAAKRAGHSRDDVMQAKEEAAAIIENAVNWDTDDAE